MLPIKKILCPTDFSEPSALGVKSATELAKFFNAEILLVHVVAAVPALPSDPNYVYGIPEYERLLHADAEKKIEKQEEELIASDLKVRTIVCHGDAAQEIVKLAAKEKADVIVIATHGSTGWRHLVFGSVAEKVVRMAGCPVLTVRCPGKTEQIAA